jgi:hypothetical protein
VLAGNPANSTLTSFTVGSVQRELAAMGSAARPGLASLPAAEFPNVVSLFGPLLTGDAEQNFTDGLQLVIDAIATRMPRRLNSRQYTSRKRTSLLRRARFLCNRII